MSPVSPTEKAGGRTLRGAALGLCVTGLPDLWRCHAVAGVSGGVYPAACVGATKTENASKDAPSFVFVAPKGAPSDGRNVANFTERYRTTICTLTEGEKKKPARLWAFAGFCLVPPTGIEPVSVP